MNYVNVADEGVAASTYEQIGQVRALLHSQDRFFGAANAAACTDTIIACNASSKTTGIVSSQ